MSETKICNKCNIEKELNQFSKLKNSKDGHQSKCKLCTSEYNKERYLKNPDVVKKRSKEWVLNNVERRKEINKLHNKKKYHENIEKSRGSSRKYNKKRWENKTYEEKKLFYKKNNDNRRKRCKNNPLEDLKYAIRASITQSINRIGYKKNSRSYEILGCAYEDFKVYIESKFEPWMNWDNRGLYNGELNYGWDLDHIIPVSLAKSEEDIIKLNHYTNFQPLCSKINRDIKRGL